MKSFKDFLRKSSSYVSEATNEWEGSRKVGFE